MPTAVLRCFTEYSDVRAWSPRVNVLERGVDATGWQDIDGVFTGSADNWFAVVRDRDRLVVARPGEERSLSSVELVEIVPTSAGGREARLKFQDGAVWTVEYAPLTPPPDEMDLTAFAEHDDFDFGEYLRSLVLDPDRQRRVFRREAP